MQGLDQSNQVANRFRAYVAKLILGGAVSCLLAAPAGATGFTTPVNWSGPWVSAGVGGAAMSSEAKVDAAREEQDGLVITCPRFECEFDGPNGKFVLKELEAPNSPVIDGDLNFLHQQLLEMDGLSDIGVFGTLALGWDHRLAGSNFVLGAFAGIDFHNIESDFKVQGLSQTKTRFDIFIKPEVVFDPQTLPDADDVVIGGALFGALLANGVGDGHVEVNGKVEQEYSYRVGGRLGFILDETFMTYFGAAWTRASIDGHVNVSISDPICVDNNCQNSLAPSPTQIRLNLDEEVDGYKLIAGGEYALGWAWGGSWFARGEASFSDYDGITEAFFGQKRQSFELPGRSPFEDAVIGIERLINESALVDLDKENLAVHAALVYKLGRAAPAPMK